MSATNTLCILNLILQAIFAAPLTGLAQNKNPTEIKFELVPRSPDDISGSFNTIVQDKQGFLWLGAQAGLFKYDGQRFINYTHNPTNPNSPADFAIWSLYVDRDGIIWISPGGFGLDRFDPTTETFTHFRHCDTDSTTLIHDEVTTMLEDRDGSLWVGTSAGLDKFDRLTKTFQHYRNKPNDPSTVSCNEIRTIYEDGDGTIWVGTGNPYMQGLHSPTHRGGLNKFDKRAGTFTRYVHAENDPTSLVDNLVQAIYEDSRGVFWVGTAKDGLHTFDRKTGKFQNYPYDAFHPNKISRAPVRDRLNYAPDFITFITEDPAGRVWIGSLQGALTIYDPATGKSAFYDVHDDGKGNLNGAGYLTMAQSSDHTLWLSTLRGELYKIKPTQTIVSHVALNKLVLKFTEDESGNLWICTTRGLVKQFRIGEYATFLFDEDSSSAANMITKVIPDENKLWVASFGGLHQVDRGTMKYSTFHHSAKNNDTPGSDIINLIESAGRDRLWLGTHDRGIDLLNTRSGTFTHLIHHPDDSTSLSNNRVLSLVRDRHGDTWIGTFLGLNKLDTVTHSFKRYLNPFAIISLYRDHAGQLWCGTDAGLFRYVESTDEFVKFIDRSLMITPTMVIGSITEDSQDNLWFVTPQKGIVRLDKGRDVAFSIGDKQGVSRQAIFGDAFQSKKSEVLLGDRSGYLVIRTNDVPNEATVPILNIDNFLIDDVPFQGESSAPHKTFNGLNALTLQHNQNSFSVEFTSIDFISDPEDLRVLYQLENYDKQWRQAEDNHSASYLNLPPDQYIFRVKAISATGMATEKKIGILIRPPWWKTIWAYSLLVAGTAGMGFVIYDRRIRKLKSRQIEQMSLMVATQEGERKRISRDLHDDVGTKLSALKLSLSALGEKAREVNHAEIIALANSSEQFITEVMQDLRQLLLNLSPTILEEFGYLTAVEALVSKLNETKKIRFEFVSFGWEKPVHKDYELALYRITQELVTNVIRHACATRVSLQVGQRDGKILLMIEDDGKGFDATVHREGYGLRNLDTRTKLMDGTMVIDSQPQKGCCVTVVIPYNSESHG